MSTTWDPQQYALFSDERSRPFGDLLAQVGAASPGLVLDLGCGNGPLTLALAERWPQARVVGVDSSLQMLAKAASLPGADRVEWREADLTDWDVTSIDGPPDVIVSNATLQWIPRHLELLTEWAEGLAPAGWLAIQVPANFDAPSHALMREVAREHPRSADLAQALRRPASAEATTYLQLLERAGLRADVWQTTYLHVLDRAGESDDPVLEWVRATGLRPVLEVLTDPAERAAFVEPYAARLREAYPRTAVGVVLPFRRTFAVAQKA